MEVKRNVFIVALYGVFFILVCGWCSGNGLDGSVSIVASTDLFVAGSDVTLTCSMTPPPPPPSSPSSSPVIGWVKTGGDLLPSTRFHEYTDGLRETSLTIHHLEIEDSGTYECSFITEGGIGDETIGVSVLKRAVSKSIVIIGDQLPQDIDRDAIISVRAGTPYNLTCTVEGAAPYANITWELPRDVLANFTDQANFRNGSLTTSKRSVAFTPTKDAHDGSVVCVVSQPSFHVENRSSVQLEVQVAPHVHLDTAGHLLLDSSLNRRSVAIIEDQVTEFRCEAVGSRPHASIMWTVGTRGLVGEVVSSSGPNRADDTLFDTLSTLRMTPDGRHHNQTLRCTSIAGGIDMTDECLLVILGPPKIYGADMLHANKPVNLTCEMRKSCSSASLHWYLGGANLTRESVPRVCLGAVAPGRFAATVSQLTLRPTQRDNRKALRCEAVLNGPPRLHNLYASLSLNVQYAPVIKKKYEHRSEAHDRFSIILTCECDSNPAVTDIQWSHGGALLEGVTGHIVIEPLERRDTGTTYASSKLTVGNISVWDQDAYECHAVAASGNTTAVFNIRDLAAPNPPLWLKVHRNLTTPSSITVAWRPAFDGGLSQTFTLKSCVNGTRAARDQETACSVQTGLERQETTVDGLQPFTWYTLRLSATNAIGDSSAIRIVTSTSPMPPLSYGITVTYLEDPDVLIISDANVTLPIGICFALVQPSGLVTSCPLGGDVGCLQPGSEVPIAQEGGQGFALVSSGRGLCSTPDYPIDWPTKKRRSPRLMSIVGGVIGTMVFGVLCGVVIILRSFLCCLHTGSTSWSLSCPTTSGKKQEEESAAQNGREVDEDGLVYIAVSHDRAHPTGAPPLRTEESTVYASLDSKAMGSSRHNSHDHEPSSAAAAVPHPAAGAGAGKASTQGADHDGGVKQSSQISARDRWGRRGMKVAQKHRSGPDDVTGGRRLSETVGAQVHEQEGGGNRARVAPTPEIDFPDIYNI